MKKVALEELPGLVAISVPGGIGVWIVARTLRVYAGRDATASLIVAVIGVALLVALAELVVRQIRAGLLEHELRALPAKPTELTLDAASPAVSALLRARLDQAPLPNLGEHIAPFMTGLLVMLGLLGTLLGLFQTVHGAGQALTSSADVDALRRSLGAPIDGLTRSFGSSAAGISASAMLGIAIALVRRREARALRVFHAYAAGPLRQLSPARRQMLALEQLVANQSHAVPGAASAMESVSAKLDALCGQLALQQQTAFKTQQRVFGELLANARAELSTLATGASEALQASVGPLFETMATESSRALATQSDALAQGAHKLTEQLERDSATRREEAAQAMQALRERFDHAEAQRAAAHVKELEALIAAAARSTSESTARERELAERWRELLARLDAQVEATHSAHDERLRSLDAQVQVAREREGEQLARLDALVARVGADLEQLTASLSQQLEQRRASEREHAEHSQQTFERLDAAADALLSGIARQETALAQLVERLPERFETAVASSQEAAQRTLAQVALVTEQRLTGVATLLSEELAERQSSARAQGEQAQQALLGVQQSANALDTAIAKQSHGLEGLIERVTGMLPGLAEAAQAGASATLARLRESGEELAVRFAELEASITRGRDEHARGLAEQLTQHAGDLEQRLAKTSSAVQEAAAVWQASSVEMQAVAELFASSVERQREASDAWLESLGEVEGAVERAGRDAARDALSDQLASTQEVFARQLQFQRELFEQLRTLRGQHSQAAHGEQDVSY